MLRNSCTDPYLFLMKIDIWYLLKIIFEQKSAVVFPHILQPTLLLLLLLGFVGSILQVPRQPFC